MSELPQSFYYIIGFLVFTNLSVIGSVVYFTFRAIWWVSKLDSRVEDAKSMSVRAHKRIDHLEKDEG